MRFAATIFLLLAVAAASAQQTPVVRVAITPDTVMVGESIEMRVIVASPTWFPEPPEYPSFEVTNAVVRLPPNSSRPSRVMVAGEAWSGITRNYEVIPLIGGQFDLGTLSMQVTYADPGDSSPVVVELDLPPIQFAASVPAGAEALNPYIAGRALDVGREFDRDLADLEAGDALVVTYTATLDGLPSMFIPEFVTSANTPGVSVYAAAPRFSDEAQATRREQLTFVFEAGGSFEIPAVTLDWWNIDSSAIETAAIEPVTVTVAGPPISMAPDLETEIQLSPTRIALLVLVVITAITVFRRIVPLISRRLAERAQRRLLSEEYAYEQLQSALRSGDSRLAYQRLLKWLERLEGSPEIQDFVDDSGDGALRGALTALRASLYAESTNEPALRSLASALNSARQDYLNASRHAARALLPELNP